MKYLTLVTGVLLSGSIFSAHATSVTFSTKEIQVPPNNTWTSLSAVSERVIWLGGGEGVIAVTDTGGERWEISQPGGRSTPLEVRQIIALDDRQAYVLTMGRGNKSRLFQTRNAGFGWRQHYRGNGDENFRCFDLIPDGEGWVLADAIDDNWHVIRSSNGSHWLSARTGFSARSLPGEQGSSRGDSCVRYENQTWALGTKNAQTARLIHKSRTSLRFQVTDTPVTAGPDNGIHAVWPLGNADILIAGGASDTDATSELFRYRDNQFEQIEVLGLSGAIHLLKYHESVLFVGNENGLMASTNMGESWTNTGLVGINSFDCVSENLCLALDTEEHLFQLKIQFN